MALHLLGSPWLWPRQSETQQLHRSRPAAPSWGPQRTRRDFEWATVKPYFLLDNTPWTRPLPWPASATLAGSLALVGSCYGQITSFDPWPTPSTSVKFITAAELAQSHRSFDVSRAPGEHRPVDQQDDHCLAAVVSWSPAASACCFRIAALVREGSTAPTIDRRHPS